MKDMNENQELLTYIYQNTKMGVTNCKDLLKNLNGKDNKIKKIILLINYFPI